MPLAFKGLAKLVEECGELSQVIGKKIAYYDTDIHPDGGPSLKVRLEDEIADVLAACECVVQLWGLDSEYIEKRSLAKLRTFMKWHNEEEPHDHCDTPAAVEEKTQPVPMDLNAPSDACFGLTPLEALTITACALKGMAETNRDCCDSYTHKPHAPGCRGY